MKPICFQEGEFCFNFKVPAEKFDEKGKATPIGMSFVDFIVLEKEHMILLEVKDPSNTKIPGQYKREQRENFAKKCKTMS